MTIMAGNFVQYEEALRALYAGNSESFNHLIEGWAPDVKQQIKKLSVHAFIEDTFE